MGSCTSLPNGTAESCKDNHSAAGEYQRGRPFTSKKPRPRGVENGLYQQESGRLESRYVTYRASEKNVSESHLKDSEVKDYSGVLRGDRFNRQRRRKAHHKGDKVSRDYRGGCRVAVPDRVCPAIANRSASMPRRSRRKLQFRRRVTRARLFAACAIHTVTTKHPSRWRRKQRHRTHESSRAEPAAPAAADTKARSPEERSRSRMAREFVGRHEGDHRGCIRAAHCKRAPGPPAPRFGYRNRHAERGDSRTKTCNLPRRKVAGFNGRAAGREEKRGQEEQHPIPRSRGLQFNIVTFA